MGGVPAHFATVEFVRSPRPKRRAAIFTYPGRNKSRSGLNPTPAVGRYKDKPDSRPLLLMRAFGGTAHRPCPYIQKNAFPIPHCNKVRYAVLGHISKYLVSLLKKPCTGKKLALGTYVFLVH
jgi:hypothetical protein